MASINRAPPMYTPSAVQYAPPGMVPGPPQPQPPLPPQQSSAPMYPSSQPPTGPGGGYPQYPTGPAAPPSQQQMGQGLYQPQQTPSYPQATSQPQQQYYTGPASLPPQPLQPPQQAPRPPPIQNMPPQQQLTGMYAPPQAPQQPYYPQYSNTPATPNSAGYNQSQFQYGGGGSPPVMQAQQQHQYAPLPPAPHIKFTAGWNDPPPMINKSSSGGKTVNSFSASTIIHRGAAARRGSFGSSSQPTNGANQNSVVDGTFMPGDTNGSRSHQPMDPQQQQHQYPTQQQQFYNPVQVAAEQQAQQQQEARECVRSRNSSTSESNVPVVQEPQVDLQEDDERLYAAFDSLYHECAALPVMSSNMNQRRKLETAHSKLVQLKTLLGGGGRLSDSTRQGLNGVAAALGARNFPAALQLVTGLAAGPAFAETSAFLPGIKQLIHLAQQNLR